ncbi:MAG: adenylate/guanylate cyclase domain-containing protein [Myxococcota bacterium]
MRRKVPLSALITAVLALVLATTAVLTWSGLQGARQTADELWHTSADSIARHTTAETLRVLEGAEPHAQVSASLIERGVLDPGDRTALLAYLEQSIDAHPTFSWLSWGDAHDGSFIGVYRVAPDQPLHRTVRTEEDGGTHYVVERRDPSGWHRIEDHTGVRHYDSRERPWFQVGAPLPRGQGAWVDSVPQPGPARRELRRAGARARDRRAARRVLRGLRDSAPVGVPRHPAHRQDRPRSPDRPQRRGHRPPRRQPRPRRHRRPARCGRPTPTPTPCSRAPGTPGSCRGAPSRSASTATSPRGHPFASAPRIGQAASVPWTVLTVVPCSELLGHAERQARRAIAFGAAAAVLALLLGLGLSRGLSREVAALRHALMRTARLDLADDGDLTSRASTIREVAEMGDATLSMRQGLRAFSRYVPHQLVRQVLASGREARLGAERRELTVLFSDIAGFTTVVESTPPDTVLAALGRYLDGMNIAIGGFGGTVCQYLGDGILAFWGAPEVLPDHAARACRGALAMQAHARRLLAEAEREGHPPLPTRIGIDTGEVMVGNIGASERFNYGILGDTVNTAARLEALNKVFGTRIVVGARTVELARAGFLFRPLDRVRVRGKQRTVVVHELLGERGADPALEAAVVAWEGGMAAYLDRRFAEAEAGFAAYLEVKPGDVHTLAMVARARSFREDPPGDEWDGVHDPN